MEGGGGRGCNFVFGHREWVPLCVVTRASHEWRRECAVLISVFHNYAPAAPHSSPRGCNVLAEPVLRAIRVGVVASSTFNCFVEILLPRFSKNQVSKSNCVFCSFFFFFCVYANERRILRMRSRSFVYRAIFFFISFCSITLPRSSYRFRRETKVPRFDILEGKLISSPFFFFEISQCFIFFFFLFLFAFLKIFESIYRYILNPNIATDYAYRNIMKIR